MCRKRSFVLAQRFFQAEIIDQSEEGGTFDQMKTVSKIKSQCP